MDYSINDADNPAGASPWGSSPVSSPKHARTSSGFASIGGAPPSPTPYGSNHSRNVSYSNDDSLGPPAFQGPESVAESVTESDRPETAESVRSEPTEQPTYSSQESHQSVPAQQQYQPEAQGSEGQRYASVGKQSQQPQAGPQYKLQAKITGLERTGRKDPILRFDVHVGSRLQSHRVCEQY
jgi:hypothetical protein